MYRLSDGGAGKNRNIGSKPRELVIFLLNPHVKVVTICYTDTKFVGIYTIYVYRRVKLEELFLMLLLISSFITTEN